MTTKTTTKTKARQAAKPSAAKPPKGARKADTVYRLSEATDGRQLIGDVPTAEAATKKAKAYAAKHGVAVEVARGKVIGSGFQAEFTDVLQPETGTATGADTAAGEPAVAAAAAKPKTPKAAKGRKAKPAAGEAGKLSALDAAAQILTGATGPMTAPELITAMAERKLWASPNGKTPAATLSAAIGREIQVKGNASRFQKAGRGKFAAR
jgi:hypothetical protein